MLPAAAAAAENWHADVAANAVGGDGTWDDEQVDACHAEVYILLFQQGDHRLLRCHRSAVADA